MTDPLDRLSPRECHLPPSDRTWARVLSLSTVPGPVLEMRDPNSGQDPDPAAKPRHQYLVARNRLWSRRLPPAPLDLPEDESPWRDGPARWMLAEVSPSSPITEWAREQGLSLADLTAPRHPHETHARRDMDGTGAQQYRGWVMPPGHPEDHWADITSYPGRDVLCPVPGCGQYLQWWEAGYVSGYRVCLAGRDDTYDLGTLRHHFALLSEPGPAILVLVHTEGEA